MRKKSCVSDCMKKKKVKKIMMITVIKQLRLKQMPTPCANTIFYLFKKKVCLDLYTHHDIIKRIERATAKKILKSDRKEAKYCQ